MSVEANIAGRKAANEVIELIHGELRTLIDQHSIEAVSPFFATLRAAFGKNLAVVSERQPPEPATTAARLQDGDVDSALEMIEEALELVDDVPERGQKFAESVADNLRSIAESIEESEEVTAGQLAAIENMKAGLERWIR